MNWKCFSTASVCLLPELPFFVLQCGDPFKIEDVIVLNGTKEEVEKLREKMEERRTKAKIKASFDLNSWWSGLSKL